jgi:hypothetical protein
LRVWWRVLLHSSPGERRAGAFRSGLNVSPHQALQIVQDIASRY